MGFTVKYYGVRGSTPTSGNGYLKYGGNTTCVYITDGKTHIIIDAGTGIRGLGNDLLNQGFAKAGGHAHIIFSHTHWDHIQGLPFFVPIYMPQNRFHIYGEAKDIPVSGHHGSNEWTIEDVLAMQQNFMYFPVATKDLASQIEYETIVPGDDLNIDDFNIHTIRMRHPNNSIGFRISCGEKAYVFCTDVEHNHEQTEELAKFCEGAEILAYDCQYTPEEYKKSKIGWGHSTYEYAIEIAKKAGVKEIHMIHHDPGHTDENLTKIEKEAQKSFKNIIATPEGHSVDL